MLEYVNVNIELACPALLSALHGSVITRRCMTILPVLMIPTIFVFCGLNLITLVIPIVFIAAAILILSPILINQQGGRTYEQA